MSYKKISLSPEFVTIMDKFYNKSMVARLFLNFPHPSTILEENCPNYIGVSATDKNKISYLSFDRIKSSEESGDMWVTSKRTFAKPGVVVKKIFKDIPEKEIELFSTLYRNWQSLSGKQEFTFKIVSGEDIRKYYHYITYANQSSSLGSSCMKYSSCQEFMDIYCKNDNIKMLVMLDSENKLVGRAILWQGVNQNIDNQEILIGPYNIMDRIYTIADERYEFHFKKWADDNGYFYKHEQRWNNTLFFGSNDIVSMLKLSIKLEVIPNDKFPYVDTFKFICFDNKTLYNYKPKDIDVKILVGSSGRYEGSRYLELDGITNIYHYSNDLVYLDYKKIWTLLDNTCYSNIMDCPIYINDAIKQDELEDWIFIDDKFNDIDLIQKKIESIRALKNKIIVSSERRSKIFTNGLTDDSENPYSVNLSSMISRLGYNLNEVMNNYFDMNSDYDHL